MTTAAYISTSQFPIMGQPGYEIDPITQQAYPTGIAGFGPTAAAHAQQQIFLTAGQPVQVIAGPSGAAVFPQMRFQNPNSNVYIQPPSSNIMPLPYTGDLHAPPAYSEMEPSRFLNPRSRRSSISMNFAAGQYGAAGNQMGQMGGGMDYSYVESCMLCRANHPGPHPHGPSMGMPDMSSMPSHRQMSTDDAISNSSKMRGSAYSYEGPMYDPMDWNNGPSLRSRDRRDPSWDYRSSKSHLRSRARSAGPRGRPERMPFNGIHVTEVSEDESEDDNISIRGRMTSYSNPARRASSQKPQRSSSRVRPVNSANGNNYL